MRILRKEQKLRSTYFESILGKKGRRRVTRVIDAKDKLANAYVLKRFYAKARKKHGKVYTTVKASLVGMRFENCEILQLC